METPVRETSLHNASVLPGDDGLQQRIDAACDLACKAIAPVWPLDRAIAVNPHWGRIDRTVREVAARMAVLGNIQVFPCRSAMRQAWEEGRITRADLAHALSILPAAKVSGLTPATCVEALKTAPDINRLPLLIDMLDDDPQRHTRLSWRQAITHQVSQTCAAYFDRHQADWQPPREQGLYAFWRNTLTHDHGIGFLMGLPDLGHALHALPTSRQEAERWVLERLQIPETVWPDYLEAVLLTVNGWASWCAYLAWQARLALQEDTHLRDLLAIRLAWGAILLESKDDDIAQRAFSALREEWSQAAARLQRACETMLVDEVWQLALDAGYQRSLALRLSAAGTSNPSAVPGSVEVQAAFCIDVRSEPMRRALEATWPAIQTIGFAGFFGLPVAYTPLATLARRPQLPGLLAPTMEVSENVIPAGAKHRGARQDLTAAAATARRRRFALQAPWLAGSRWPNAAYAFVESAGVGYIAKLAHWLVPSTAARPRDDFAGLPARYKPICRPVLAGVDLPAKVDLAARVLHAMGLDRYLAPLVLLVGHGSQSANNAHAASLDCGACCGQTGEVNARVLAQLLNEPAVRTGLLAVDIKIPESTVFLAAVHNTTTDEIEGYDLDLLPHAARERWERLQPVLVQACDQLRRERAPRLGLDPRADRHHLLAQLRRRANDGAQTRPEWGLAGNAAFIIAPRHRSQGAVLDGRTFLHDYDAAHDPDGSVLDLLLTAPMLVAHWINWQYHASTCEPLRMGCGNKVLHNVVGAHIGVFEGNSGDLRIGLSRQSLHDGVRWMHEPLRLTVVIDAPASAIERVICGHAVVRQLLDNGWLHLWRFGDQGFERYDRGQWPFMELQNNLYQHPPREGKFGDLPTAP